MTSEDKSKPAAPEPERSKSGGNWQDVVKQALDKKKPSSGWPARATNARPEGKGKVKGKGNVR